MLEPIVFNMAISDFFFPSKSGTFGAILTLLVFYFSKGCFYSVCVKNFQACHQPKNAYQTMLHVLTSMCKPKDKRINMHTYKQTHLHIWDSMV
jgi:hypothetical protein